MKLPLHLQELLVESSCPMRSLKLWFSYISAIMQFEIEFFPLKLYENDDSKAIDMSGIKDRKRMYILMF